MTPLEKSDTDLAQTRTELAAKRTVMAADRSLMAWVRTALSMISFGFTLYKVLEGFHESGQLVFAHRQTPQTVGLFLTGLGTLSVVLGGIEYWVTLKEMRKITPFRLLRPSFAIAVIMCTAGGFIFVSIVLRLL